MIKMNWNLVDNPCKEVVHQLGNLRMMALQGEMTAGNKVYLGIWKIALECLGTGRDERRVVLSPDSQQWGLIGTEGFLKLRVEGNVRAIVENEVVLHLCPSWLADIIVIE